jgi:Cys-tRNA(Pro)/Cys-tRNA(Cys) deacylase
MAKTNVMRILDKAGVKYTTLSYPVNDNKTDGISVAKKIDRSESQVFKTLVTIANNKNFYVFVIPVNSELNLKSAANVAGVKKIDMIPSKTLLQTTGYIKGGCSPIGMKKQFTTYIHSSANNLETMVVSAGKIGLQIELSPGNLLSVTRGVIADM